MFFKFTELCDSYNGKTHDPTAEHQTTDTVPRCSVSKEQ